jgi:hypothetical protein
MKKIGDVYTARGQVPVNEVNFKIQLFDGSFDTAFRIIGFTIVDGAPLNNNEFMGVLSTEPQTVATSFDFSHQTEIAWALWNAPNVYSGPLETWVDPDNLVVEDLYFSNRGGSDNTFLNYMITMQKYQITDWRGGLAMVRNRSQA